MISRALRQALRRVRWVWNDVLIRLGVVKLYQIEYGETDWVQAFTARQAVEHWLRFQRDSAGEQWVGEVLEEYGGQPDVSRDRDIDHAIGGDVDFEGQTVRDCMHWTPVPGQIGSSVY